MKLCYNDLDIVYIDYYKYKWSYLPWRGYCKENYEKRLEAKKKGDTFEVYHRKLLNNSLYGKLLENGHPIRFENYVDEQGAIDSIEHPVEDPPLGGKYTYERHARISENRAPYQLIGVISSERRNIHWMLNRTDSALLV